MSFLEFEVKNGLPTICCLLWGLSGKKFAQVKGKYFLCEEEGGPVKTLVALLAL